MLKWWQEIVLALKLLQGDFGEGDRIEIDAGDGALSFEKAEA